MMKPAIGILGTGHMGSALAHALLDAGYPTTAWNRTREKAEPLIENGAVVASSVREAIEASQIVIVNVSDYSASAEILRDEAVVAALRGKLIVDLSSGTPEEARKAASWAADRGARYLDGAILASPDFIGTDAGTILVSGPRESFDSHMGLFRVLGGNVQHVGEDTGLANALDAAMLSLMWGALFGSLQAIAVCRAEDIDLDELARQWTATVPVVEGLVSDLIKRTEAGRFAGDAETLATISPHYGAFQHLLALMETRGIDRSVANGYQAIFQRAIAAGHLHDDFAALSQFMDEPVSA